MGTIDRTSPMPLWAQLLEDLRSRLEAGEFDQQFPTDSELTSQYDLSRHTVREAVRHLQDEGLVSRERGRGSFVTAAAIKQPSGALYSLFRSIEGQGYDQHAEVVSLAEVTDPEVAPKLGLDSNGALIRLERIRFVDRAPLATDVVWLPARFARPLLDADFSHTALYDELQERCGIRPTAGTEWVNTRLPTQSERAVLGIPARQPVFSIERMTSVDTSMAVEFRRTVIRGDRYSFVARWSPSSEYSSALELNPDPAPGHPDDDEDDA